MRGIYTQQTVNYNEIEFLFTGKSCSIVVKYMIVLLLYLYSDNIPSRTFQHWPDTQTRLFQKNSTHFAPASSTLS